jgi:hypothetical protein
MSTLEDAVRAVVETKVNAGELFTALDVSNEVKSSWPLARHGEVRDMVRAQYAEMQKSGYGRTPINVTIADGSVREALLYHHLSDSWDLNAKYDAQRRAQTTVNTRKNTVTATPSTPTPAVSVMSNVPVAVTAPAVTVPAKTPVTVADPKQLWDNLFSGSNGARLFPRQ